MPTPLNPDAFEILWNAQRPAAGAPPPAPATIARELEPELRRRSRFFAYELFCLVLGLVLTPVLAVVNYLHRAPEMPLLAWSHKVLYVVAVVALLVGAIRRLRRHRALATARADTLAASARRALATLEAEMRDYRLGGWILGVSLALVALSIYSNLPVTTHGWTPFLLRLGSSVAFVGFFGIVCRWHYRKNLEPELARRRSLVAEFSSSP